MTKPGKILRRITSKATAGWELAGKHVSQNWESPRPLRHTTCPEHPQSDSDLEIAWKDCLKRIPLIGL
jgi:hypothetical protein